jgi:hypothetical protein
VSHRTAPHHTKYHIEIVWLGRFVSLVLEHSMFAQVP